MQITTSLLPGVGDSNGVADTSVVIDVLRATTVMTVALAAGAKQIITCRDVDQATDAANAITPAALLCGERKCVLIPGFDLGNSPAEYIPSVVGGRSLILTTTNGTAAIETAASSRDVIAASFLNLSAVVDRISTASQVHLICAGTDGCISNEDILLAGAIISRCRHRYQATLSGDSSHLAVQLWHAHFPPSARTESVQLAQLLRETRGGRNLIRVGYQQDIERCSQIDSVNRVPERSAQSPTTFR